MVDNTATTYARYVRTARYIYPDLKDIDFDAEAQAILKNARETALTILDKRERMNRKGQDDTPLMVFSGEIHEIPADQLNHMAVTLYLQQAGADVTLAFERPQNLLVKTFNNYHRKQMSNTRARALGHASGTHSNTAESSLAHALQSHDHDGTLTLQTVLAKFHAYFTDHARKMLCYYALQEHIPVIHSDVARLQDKNRNTCLDSSDAATLDSLSACGYDQSNFFVQSEAGMHVRNHNMLTCDNAAARHHNTDIILQCTGNTHITGKKGQHPVRWTLPGLCQEYYGDNWLAFVPGISDQAWHECIDWDALGTAGLMDNIAIRRDMSAYEIKYTQFREMMDRPRESAYVNTIRHHPDWITSGFNAHSLSAEGYWQERERLRLDLEQFFKQPHQHKLAI